MTLTACIAASCSGEPAPGAANSNAQLAAREQMLDPKFCDACHRGHYEEWRGSMHAYATDDPVFRALNAKMQRESPPEQQAFCLQCHAPMAVRLGVPLDMASLDARPELKGVGCIFCHSVESIGGSNNNPLRIHEKHEMFGAIREPIDPVVHRAEYSPRLDSKSDGSAGLCGPCHDIVTVRGAHIERTFREWSTSRFGVAEETKKSCGACHLPERDGPAAVIEGAPQRKVHDHSMAGVDVALTSFPGKEDQRARVQNFLDDAISTRLCVTANGAGAQIDVALRNEKVGHGWPSGSNQDRRAWLEVVATKSNAVVFESGRIPDDASIASAADPDLFLLRDHDFDADGNETELFWRSAKFTSAQLAPPSRATPDPTVHKTYATAAMPDTVTVVLKLRPVDFDFLAAAEIDLASVDPIATFRLAGSERVWTASGPSCVP